MTILPVSKEVVDVLLAKGVIRERALTSWGRLKLDNPELFRLSIEAIAKIPEEEVRKQVLDILTLILAAIHSQEEVEEMEDDDGSVWLFVGEFGDV